MFDSPFEYCTTCGQYVLLDQTQMQCAREYGCATPCPLQQFFTGLEFVPSRADGAVRAEAPARAAPSAGTRARGARGCQIADSLGDGWPLVEGDHCVRVTCRAFESCGLSDMM